MNRNFERYETRADIIEHNKIADIDSRYNIIAN